MSEVDPVGTESQYRHATSTARERTVRSQRLEHLPITVFGAAMGLAGLALAWRRASALSGAPVLVGQVLFWVALVGFGAMAVGYLVKAVVHPDAVRAEAAHPVRLAFLPTPGIALVLLAAAGQDLAPRLAEGLWWTGAAAQLVLTLYVVSAWIGQQHFTWAHVTPAWFIPVVGLSAAPLAGGRFAPGGISWFFLGTGLVFWIALLPLVLGRLVLQGEPLPAKLAPTLAILIAPPAVVLLAYLRLVEDPFGTPLPQVLFGVAVFFALLVAAQAPVLVRAPFAISAWAYSFPLAALSAATTVMSDQYGGILVPVSWSLLAVVSLVVTALVVRTARAILADTLFVPE